MFYDLTIIGGGPAGVAAGVYAARKELRTLFITKDWNSQSVVSEGIENWIGTVKIKGVDFAKNLEEHLRAYAKDYVDIKVGEGCEKIEKIKDHFKITREKGSYESKTVLITTGSFRKKLEVKGADTFEHKGLTYCASCDGPLFSGQDVAVVGGGNAGFETALQLLAYAKSVTLIHRNVEFKADPITVEKARSHPNMRTIANAEPTEVKGGPFVTGLVYKDKHSGELKELAVSGIFAEIGVMPNTDFVKSLVKLDTFGRIPVDPRNQRTEVDGIWAAGDCTNELYHQNNIAAGDGVKALEDIYLWIKKQ